MTTVKVMSVCCDTDLAGVLSALASSCGFAPLYLNVFNIPAMYGEATRAPWMP